MNLDVFHSRHLSDERWIWSYESRFASPSSPVRLLIWLDGQSLQTLCAVMESMERLTELPPFVVVGTESRASRRSKEYCPDADPSIFRAHRRFLIDEVLPWSREHWSVNLEPTSIGIGGFSNGALASLWLAMSEPEIFGSVVAFSPSGGSDRYDALIRKATCRPNIYLAAGSRETPFRRTAERLTQKLAAKNANVVCNVRHKQTHSMNLWSEEFPKAIQWWLNQ